MASPQKSRMQYENNTINATGESSANINYIVNSSALNNLSIDIRGDEHLIDIDKGTESTVANVTDIAKWIVAKPVNYRGVSQNQSLQSLGAGSPKVLSLAEEDSRLSKGERNDANKLYNKNRRTASTKPKSSCSNCGRCKSECKGLVNSGRI